MKIRVYQHILLGIQITLDLHINLKFLLFFLYLDPLDSFTSI